MNSAKAELKQEKGNLALAELKFLQPATQNKSRYYCAHEFLATTRVFKANLIPQSSCNETSNPLQLVSKHCRAAAPALSALRPDSWRGSVFIFQSWKYIKNYSSRLLFKTLTQLIKLFRPVGADCVNKRKISIMLTV